MGAIYDAESLAENATTCGGLDWLGRLLLRVALQNVEGTACILLKQAPNHVGISG